MTKGFTSGASSDGLRPLGKDWKAAGKGAVLSDRHLWKARVQRCSDTRRSPPPSPHSYVNRYATMRGFLSTGSLPRHTPLLHTSLGRYLSRTATQEGYQLVRWTRTLPRIAFLPTKESHCLPPTSHQLPVSFFPQIVSSYMYLVSQKSPQLHKPNPSCPI